MHRQKCSPRPLCPREVPVLPGRPEEVKAGSESEVRQQHHAAGAPLIAQDPWAKNQQSAHFPVAPTAPDEDREAGSRHLNPATSTLAVVNDLHTPLDAAYYSC